MYSVNIVVVTQIVPGWFIEVDGLCFSPQLRETRQSVRDSESGLERLSIGHHLGERAHIMERSRNRRTGDREERQDFINLEESEYKWGENGNLLIDLLI